MFNDQVAGSFGGIEIPNVDVFAARSLASISPPSDSCGGGRSEEVPVSERNERDAADSGVSRRASWASIARDVVAPPANARRPRSSSRWKRSRVRRSARIVPGGVIDNVARRVRVELLEPDRDRALRQQPRAHAAETNVDAFGIADQLVELGLLFGIGKPRACDRLKGF
jgi:hypothetical protein